MDLVDINDVLGALLLNAVHDLLDAVLEVATILGACKKGADVELIDAAALETLGHTAFLNHSGKAPDEGGLPHSGLAHMQRIVLIATAEHLDSTLQLLLATDEGIVVLEVIVHAGNESAPGVLVFASTCLLFQMVVELIGADKLAHEDSLLIDEGLLEQEASPRLLELQNAHDEMGHIEGLGAAVHHLFVGKIDDLLHLSRHLRGIVLTIGDGLGLLEFLLEFLGQRLWRIKTAEHLIEGIVIGQCQQEVFGHDELMSVFFAAVEGES